MRIINFSDGFTSATAPTVEQLASSVSVTPTGNLSSTNVQAALVELQGDADTLDGALDTHIGDVANPHAVTKTQVGLGNVDNVLQIALTEKGAVSGVAELDSGGKVPLAQLPDSVVGALSYLGTWNASTNSPTLSNGSGDQGNYYVVNTAGSTSLDGITDWKIGDWVVSNGSAWEKIDNTESVVSVAGQTGVVTLDLDDMTDVDLSTPPSEGQGLIYQAGAWVPGAAGGGSGSGELNLIGNPSAAFNVTGWSETGSVFSTPARTTTSGDLPLEGIVSTAIKLVASGSAAEATAYNSYSFTTPASLAAKLKVEFYMRPGTGFVASEWTVSVYASSTRQPLSTDSSSVTLLPMASGKFTTTFDCAASTAYTLRFARTSGSGSATLNVANVIVGPGIQPQGAMVGPTLSYTPTFNGFGTVTNVSFTYVRVGDRIRINGSYTSGTPTATQAQVSLPTGLTSGITGTQKLVGYFTTAPGTTVAPTVISEAGLGYLTFGFAANITSTPFNGLTKQNGDQFGASTAQSFFAELPIAEWSSSGTVNLAQNDVEYAYNADTSDADNTTSFGYGPGGTVFPSSTLSANRSKRVRFQTPVAGCSVWIEIDARGTGNFVQQSGIVLANGLAEIDPFHNQNTVSFGFGRYSPVSGSSTDVDLMLARYPSCTGNGTYTASGTNWGASTGVAKWRLCKAASGQAVGFGEVVPGISSGLVSASGLKGRTDGGAIASRYVGEEIRQTRLESAATSLTTGTSANVTASPLILTAGVWEISGSVGFTTSGTTNVTGLRAAISATSAALPATDTQAVANTAGEYRGGLAFGSTVPGGIPIIIPIPPYRINTTGTTLYLIANGSFTVSTLSAYGSIRAVRIA